MADPITVLALPGALRRDSYNRALTRACVDLAPEGMRVGVYEDLGAIPLYDGDVEAAGMPAPVAELRARLASADALLIASPEYNRSVPGVLKNALDWASRGPDSPLRGLPVAIVGASPGLFGTARAQPHLRQVLLACGAPVLPAPELYVMGAAGKIEDGRVTDADTRERLAAVLSALADWARRLRA